MFKWLTAMSRGRLSSFISQENCAPRTLKQIIAPLFFFFSLIHNRSQVCTVVYSHVQPLNTCNIPLRTSSGAGHVSCLERLVLASVAD